jgi:hypothetical protein
MVVKDLNIKSKRITLAMKKSQKRKSKFNSKSLASDFTARQLTKYAGLSPIMAYINHLKIGQQFNTLFPTTMHNATKFTDAQILLSVILASLAGVNRLIRIAVFTCDALILALLGLSNGLNKDVISARLKALGQTGAIYLQEHLFGFTTNWLAQSQLESITIDGDSTVRLVYGNQEGAAKGYNPRKPGAKSYHPLLAFVSEMKLVVNSWFRTGSAYTSNGICDFIQQIHALLPANIKQTFFRADSGFFNGRLFDLLEALGWTYLVKVKLRNLKQMLLNQKWIPLPDNPNIAICDFSYQANGWSKPRTLRAIRTITEWIDVDFMGELQTAAKYEYACYCSNLDEDADQLHDIYKERSTSETWIEQVKSQLLAGSTLTDDFHANDMLWQLSVFAYNLSVMMRVPTSGYWKQEHATFRDWFINLPAILVRGSRYLKLKIYEHYYFKTRWIEFEHVLVNSV